MVTLALMGALLVAEGVAAGHHHCQGGEGGSCAICLLATTASCLPEAAPAALPIPASRLGVVLQPALRPSARSVFSITARGPPLETL